MSHSRAATESERAPMLRPDGFACVHALSTSCLSLHISRQRMSPIKDTYHTKQLSHPLDRCQLICCADHNLINYNKDLLCDTNKNLTNEDEAVFCE